MIMVLLVLITHVALIEQIADYDHDDNFMIIFFGHNYQFDEFAINYDNDNFNHHSDDEHFDENYHYLYVISPIFIR